MKIGMLFAGQGSQYVGMGKEICENYEEAKEIYDNIDLDFPLKQYCFEGPQEKLLDTSYAQSCILATSMAMANVIKKHDIKVDYVAGLSLGEYSALCYSEVLSIKDACNIVRSRGKIMAEALSEEKTGMVAILNMEVNKIAEVCEQVKDLGVCEIANYNCPGQIVITGEKVALEKACALLKEKGCRRMVPLQGCSAFHSSLLKEASKKLENVLKQYTFQKKKIPVVYNVSGKEEEKDIISLLCKQIQSSVYFMQSIEYMIQQGVDTFITIGPGTSLKNFVRKTNKEVKIYSVDDVTSLKNTIKELTEWKEKQY